MLNDVIAGVTLALTSIPQAVAYAEVSGVAGWRGLATMGFPCVAFAAATGSPWASIGVTSRQPASGPPPPRRRVSPPGRRRSITAMLARDALAAAHAALPEDDYVLVMAAFATIVGLASTALALCGAGGVAVRRIPGPVKAGFKLGFGCAVVSSQCATALFRGGKARLREAAGDDAAWAGPSRAAAAAAAAGLGGAPQVVRLAWAAGHPGAWDWDVAALSAVVVVGTLRGKALLPRRAPPGLEVLVLVGLATGLSAAGFYAGGVVGAPPAGAGGARSLAVAPWDLPFRRLVDLCYGGSVAAPRDRAIATKGGRPRRSWAALAKSSVVFAAVDFLQSVSVCSAFEAENGHAWSCAEIGHAWSSTATSSPHTRHTDRINPTQAWSPDRELAAQGVASVASGAFRGGPCGASLSRSMLARLTGATSRAAGFVHGVAAISLLPYAGALAATPKAALAAVVLAAVGPGVARPKGVLALRGSEAGARHGVDSARGGKPPTALERRSPGSRRSRPSSPTRRPDSSPASRPPPLSPRSGERTRRRPRDVYFLFWRAPYQGRRRPQLLKSSSHARPARSKIT